MDLAAAVRSQMFATLLAAMESPATTPGAVVEGRLVALSPAGQASVRIGAQTLQLAIATPEGAQATLGGQLQLGALLRLRIEPSDPGLPLRATLVGLTPQAVKPESEAAAADPQALLGHAVATAAARQSGLAPLFANLEALVKSGLGNRLPPKVIRAAMEALGLRYDPRTADARALRSAVEHSGVFHEALLAAGDGGHADIAGTDLKSALLALKLALSEAMPEGETPATGRVPSAPLRPPHRDALPPGQPAVLPELDGAAKPEEALGLLARQTDGGLDRLRLLQVASMPAEPRALADPAHAQRWLVELPMALDGRTQVLPLRIEREPGQRTASEGDSATWRVRFALDGEPLGPLQAIVSWSRRRIGVTLWAERETTREVLRGASIGLRNALAAPGPNGLPPEEIGIDILNGAPAEPRPAPGVLLDRRS